MTIAEKIAKIGALPVAVVDSSESAESLARALVRGGIPTAEVTFRTGAAAEVIRRMRECEPDMLVGAGTVLTAEQALAAAEAGAQFIVSPGLNPEVVKTAQGLGLEIIPGVLTPTEVELALSLGLTRLKFFPAEAGGGAKMIRAMSAPYPMVRWFPTGGISPENLADYLAVPSVMAGGLSWMCERALVNAGDFDEIERRAAKCAEIVRSARG